MSKKLKILRILLVICLISFVIFAVGLVRELYVLRQGQSFYEKMLSETATQTQRQETSIIDGTTPGQGVTDEGWIPYVDFETLRTIFPGIVAWIKLDGTPIDYPVMQGSDNEYFLTHLPDGTRHRSGSVFLDHRNSNDFSDKSTVIYGHESRFGEMFASLKNYRKQEFYEEHPIIYLYTPERDYKILLFAGYLADSHRDAPPLNFRDDVDFLDYVDSLKNKSMFKSDIEVTANDRIVSLASCAYDFEDARWIVVGVLD